MSDLERRALLGDKEAQAECTAKGIALTCPCCGGPADLKQLSGRWSVCCKNNCVGTRIFNDQARPLATWNTRQAPPIGRCGTCKRNHLRSGKWFCEVRGIVHDLDDFCSYYEPKEIHPKPTCAACTNFLGGGDWGLCCKVSYDLCYQDSPACENFKAAVAQQVKEAP